ncbi:MAG TPA: DUF5666 domain-containing protein [bacterium]|nr:DUF5666 domain-containing protein [bacterium]
MRRVAWMMAAALACALAVATPLRFAGVPRARAAAAVPAALARGWARVSLAGTLVSASPASGLMSVETAAPSRAEVFEGGAAWRTLPLFGRHFVRVLPQSVMADSASRPIGWDALRTGDHVAIWGVMNPGEEIMALSMTFAGPRAAKPAARGASAGPAAGVVGVVTGRSGSTIDLVTDTGTRHAVLVTAATQVQAAGLAAAASVSPFDVVQVDGAVNSDGSVVAAHVIVQFLSSQGAQVSGPIDAVRRDVGGLLVGGTMVCTSAQTYFVQGTSRRWIAQMAVGRPVTVYGLPILAGKTPVGLAARVIAVR